MIFNKGAVMVLPPGCNKASGLKHALAELGLSPRNGVAGGDGENDHALLEWRSTRPPPRTPSDPQGRRRPREPKTTAMA